MSPGLSPNSPSQAWSQSRYRRGAKLDHVLVIDDKPDFLATQIQHVFTDGGLVVHRADSCELGLELAIAHDPAVVLIELHPTSADGLKTFHRVRDLNTARPVIVVTDRPQAQNVIECIRSGAFDYLAKPVQLTLLQEVLQRALAISRQARLLSSHPAPASPAGEDELFGRSPAMHEVFKTIGLVAGQNVSVLILGESGTGKELVSHAIRQHSQRVDKPYLVINCAAIPEQLLESELFGHEKGSFTGADRKRIGKFEQCHGGTLFLDEIGDMCLSTQAKILRVIQQQEFIRVGGCETIRTDVRLIAATNRDLNRLVEQNQFRLDLLYRLNTVTLRVPPLRERGDDLQLLADHFLRRANAEFGRTVVQISPQARQLLAAYSWPGNVRELQGVIHEAVLRCTGPLLMVDHLSQSVQATPHHPPVGKPMPLKLDLALLEPLLHAYVSGYLSRGEDGVLSVAVEAFERKLYQIVWILVGHNQVKASKLLGVSRNYFRKKISEFGLEK
jgi:two-component system, NtrC family, response regulator AtoC